MITVMCSMMIAGGTVEVDADLPGILDALERQVVPLAGLVRAGTVGSHPVAGLEWTVDSLHAHLAATAANYARMADGEIVMTESAFDRRAVIDRGIAEQLGPSTAEHAEVIERGVAQLVASLRSRTDDHRVPFYGMDVAPSLVAGMCLNELVVHGVDLARTHHAPLDVPDGAAYHSLLATCTLTAFALTPWATTRRMTFGYAVDGHRPIVMALDRGTVAVDHDTSRRVDAWFGGSASDLLLACYHRVGTARALRTLRLRGRRPYLGLIVDKIFQAA